MLLLVVAGQMAGGPGIWALGPLGQFGAGLLVLTFPALATVGLLAGTRGPVDLALRGVVAASVTLWIVAATAALVAAIAHGANASIEATLTAVALATAVAGAGGWWAAGRAADLLVFGGRPDPLRASAATSAAITGTTSLDQLLRAVATQAQRSIGSAGVRAEAYGTRVSVPLDCAVIAEQFTPFAFVAGGTSVGSLGILPRKAESALTRRDATVARAIAAAASPALEAARATQQLIDARARLLVAREEERRTLRRDLHDDLAPTLVGLGLTASGIARMLRGGHSTAAAESIATVAEALVEDLHGAIAQTREIAHGLRPPALDDRGLVAVIRDRTASSLEADGLVVHVHASPDPLVLPAAIEVSALRIVQEAVTNARRHARASRCDVRIATTADALMLEIIDDGEGMPPTTASTGLGLESMRERARELGGSLQVDAGSGGGTRVRARIPLTTAVSHV
jgi:signal transduction histidine kinase